MNNKVEGIILKINDYKENDQLIFALCKEYGVLTLIGKSSKKINSKQHFYEGCQYEFIIDYVEHKTIFGIHGSKLIKSFIDLKNTKLFAYKNIMFDLTYKVQNELDIDTYDNLLFLLENINDENKYLIGTLYISYLSKILGICPNVDECVTCKNKKVIAISNKLGGFVCGEHLGVEKIIEVERLRKFRLISKASFKDYKKIQNESYDFLDFKLIMNFFLHNSDLVSKPFEFYSLVSI